VRSDATLADRLASRRIEAGPPLFRRRSGVYHRKSARVEQPFPDGLASALADAGPRRLTALVLAATAAVLYRYQGTTDAETIIVASPAGEAGEDGGSSEQPEILPLPLEVSAQISFADLLQAAEAVIAEAAIAEVSAAGLAEALGLGHVTSRHPFAPVVLVTEGLHGPIPDLRNDVTVTVLPGRGLECEYNANVLGEDTIRRFAVHLVTFLGQGLADPAGPVSAVDYLPEAERESLLALTTGGASPVSELCLHELFEAEARENPDAEAVCFGDETLTYGELDAQASRLANYLRSKGAGRGDRVGLCLSAGSALLIGVIAVLKSGAAVVPIVPTFPVARSRMAIDDSMMRLMVTESSLRDAFAGTDLAVVCLDADSAAIRSAEPTAPESGVTPADPVYVLFTSGSTGRPKGAVLCHATLVNLVTWQRDRGADPAGRRTLQRTSIGFDVSFQEIFSTLGFGGSLVIAPDDVRDDVSLLPGFIEQHGISRLFLPPVALSQLALTAGLEQRSLPALTEIIVAGEQLSISMPVRRFFHQLDCSLDNQYGPTETHVVTAFAVTGPSTRWAERPPIGKPVRNVRTYVLDAWLRPVPIGVPGEIYVGGTAATGRYLDEEETAARFIPDPHSAGDGRMYRTGDRARILPDGDLEYLGRDDDQVKIRGYRIELGEVEAALARVPGVTQAAAAVHDSGPLGKQLTGYVVSDSEPDVAAIRRLMLEHLPAHMVPATGAIVRLDQLPLTPTGKVNRRELPPPPRPALAEADGAVSGGDTEQAVAKIWSAALGLNQVRHDASLIELGGHSLVGIQIVSQLNEVFSVSLPLRSLLRGITVSALAAEIDQARGTDGEAPPQAEPASGTGELGEVTLPDGRRLACLQPAETQYLYLDVFEHRTYHRGGIRFDGGAVFDVGAHIGLFTLYALEQAPDSRVFAFEPCPPLFTALVRNTEPMAGVRRFPFGLGSSRDTAELTFYPNLTGMSSFHPDEAEERQLLSGILANLGRLDGSDASLMLADSEQYLTERLVATTFRCERRTVSDMIGELGLDRIGLLKVDVQKAELDVLRGIAPADWPKIDQLAVEVHDLDGALAEITALLTARGYQVSVEQDSLHKGTVVHFAFAVRP
jgi:amino acid adenylation domain-containing protein/FkbM family methyltransferase